MGFSHEKLPKDRAKTRLFYLGKEASILAADFAGEHDAVLRCVVVRGGLEVGLSGQNAMREPIHGSPEHEDGLEMAESLAGVVNNAALAEQVDVLVVPRDENKSVEERR
jgi:hypothetical protein